MSLTNTLPLTPQQTINGSILTPDGWIDGKIDFAEQRIVKIAGTPTDQPQAPYIMPGFIDLHVHGGAGQDSMQGEAAIRQMAALHGQHGTTSLLATSVTAPHDEIEHFLQAVQRLADEALAPGTPGIPGDTEIPGASGTPQGARILGAHLEGPFINTAKLGAQPDAVSLPTPSNLDKMREWLTLAPVKVVTLAPENEGAEALITMLQAEGCKVQLGHSICAYAQAAAAIHQGCGVTHLYNAMSGHQHRGNGLAGAALAHSDYAEIIPDLCHVEPGAILAARRAIPYLYGVTDATAGAGMPDGQYELGSHTVTKADNAMRLADGTLAGSALTMDQALRNLVSIGLPLAEASYRLSRYPADWLGRDDLGRLAVDCLADMVVMDQDLSLQQCFVGGTALR